MNQESLEIVIETVQTFMELKRQNYLIQAWIQLKKNCKSRSIAQSRSHLSKKSYLNHNSSQHLEKLNFKHQQSFNGSNTPTLSPRSHAKYQRMTTQYMQPRVGQGLFETFNQNKSAHWVPPSAAEQSHQRARNMTGYEENYSPELEDSDQFQDIVLDRLSKLQRSVNQMMRQKKIKQTLRGYVGAPIQHNKRMEDFFQEDHSLPVFVQPPTDRSNQAYAMSPKRREERRYQSWQTSPVGKPKEQVSYNMKYIPIPAEQSPVNLTKIRKILQEKSQKGSSIGSSRARDERDIPSYGPHVNGIKTETKQGVYPQKKIDQAYVNHLKGQFQARPTQEPQTSQKSKDLYNKYGFSNTTKHQNTSQGYVNKQLEMQSVTQSRNKFVRTPKSNSNHVSYSKPQYKPTEPKVTYAGRVSGASSSSGYSYFSTPGWRAEKNTYY